MQTSDETTPTTVFEKFQKTPIVYCRYGGSMIYGSARALIREITQGLVPEVPYFWTSNDQIVVLKVP